MRAATLIGMVGLRVLGTALTFAISIYIARVYGAADLGAYNLFVSLCAGLLIIGKFGADNVLVHDVAVALAAGRPSAAVGSWQATLTMSLIISVLLVLVVWLVGPRALSWIFNPGDVARVMNYAIVVLLPATLLALSLGALRGAGWVSVASAVEVLLVPSAILTMLVVSSASPIGAYVFGIILGAAVGGVLVSHVLPAVGKSEWPALVALLRRSWHIVGISLIDFVSNWSAGYALAIWRNDAEVGVYTASWRMVIAFNMAMLVMDQINAPRFANLHSSDQMVKLEHEVRQTASIGVVLATAMLGVVLVLTPTILGWFGPEFVAGYSVVLILAAGQAVSLSCGSSGYLLIMTGNSRLLRNINASVLIIQLLLLPALVKGWGIQGAALAASVAVALNKLVPAVLAHRVLGLRVHPSTKHIRQMWRQCRNVLTTAGRK